jgi:hypothetical protein
MFYIQIQKKPAPPTQTFQPEPLQPQQRRNDKRCDATSDAMKNYCLQKKKKMDVQPATKNSATPTLNDHYHII